MSQARMMLEDLMRMATGAATSIGGAREEVSAQMRVGLDRLAARLELAGREELDIVSDMIAEARDRQESLEARVDALEETVSRLEKKAASAGAGRSPKRRSGTAKAAPASAKSAGKSAGKSG